MLSESTLEVSDIINKINSLFQDSNYVKIPSVICSTTHKFKGREADNVNLLSETFRNGRRKMTPEEAQEEQNIYYVGLSRSRKRLSLVSN